MGRKNVQSATVGAREYDIRHNNWDKKENREAEKRRREDKRKSEKRILKRIRRKRRRKDEGEVIETRT